MGGYSPFFGGGKFCRSHSLGVVVWPSLVPRGSAGMGWEERGWDGIGWYGKRGMRGWKTGKKSVKGMGLEEWVGKVGFLGGRGRGREKAREERDHDEKKIAYLYLC